MRKSKTTSRAGARPLGVGRLHEQRPNSLQALPHQLQPLGSGRLPGGPQREPSLRAFLVRTPRALPAKSPNPFQSTPQALIEMKGPCVPTEECEACEHAGIVLPHPARGADGFEELRHTERDHRDDHLTGMLVSMIRSDRLAGQTSARPRKQVPCRSARHPWRPLPGWASIQNTPRGSLFGEGKVMRHCFRFPFLSW